VPILEIVVNLNFVPLILSCVAVTQLCAIFTPDEQTLCVDPGNRYLCTVVKAAEDTMPEWIVLRSKLDGGVWPVGGGCEIQCSDFSDDHSIGTDQTLPDISREEPDVKDESAQGD